MPGSAKKKARLLRERGENDLADWFEAKEKARADGLVLWKWLKDNPKPGTEVKSDAQKRSEGYSRLIEGEEEFKGGREWEIPVGEKRVLEKIRQSKAELKVKAKEAAARNADTELKTLFKVIKRLSNEERKIVFRYDFKAFDEYMFQDLQDRVDTADFHFDMVRLYERSKRACVVCPRGHAKSTTARKYILHQILYELTRYTILVGASEDMAAQNLRWIRDQFTDNERLIEVYGYWKNKDKWADTEFQTNNGIKVTAKGAGQKIRGANERGRPDLIYIDDLEEDEQVSSKDRREKLRRWFTQALMPAKSRMGRVIMTGTILHLDSLLKNISENLVKDHLDWSVLFYQAIGVNDEGEEYALWEEHKPLEELKKLREIDPETFAQEYQNNPVSGSMGVFKREEYRYYDASGVTRDESGHFSVNGKRLNILVTTDLALSEKEGSDYTVFMVTGMDDQSNLYVLGYERFRSSDPYEQIDILFRMLGEWGCDMLTMEQVAFQKTFKRIFEYEMEKRGVYFYIHEMARQAMRKIFRIKSLKGPIRAGKLYWLDDHYEIEEELGQVTTTSLGSHDDVIDCLADAWELQFEMYEDKGGRKAEINTVEWLIETGQFKTEVEINEEMALY